jgi:hypothetical protein
MTHDELKALIENKFNNQSPLHDAQIVNALYRVVELHKPIEEDGKLWCREEVCYNHIEFLERNNCGCSYPCPTIQAIEKELG